MASCEEAALPERRQPNRPHEPPHEAPRDRHLHKYSLHLYSVRVGSRVSLIRAHRCCRSIYRIVEFADGFDGPIAHNQQLFSESPVSTRLYPFRTICADVFDGVMVTLAMYTLNILNPGHLLQVSSMNTYSGTSSYEMEEGKQRTP